MPEYEVQKLGPMSHRQFNEYMCAAYDDDDVIAFASGGSSSEAFFELVGELMTGEYPGIRDPHLILERSDLPSHSYDEVASDPTLWYFFLLLAS